MKSIAMFNNKGGVGKTTLTCNLASYIATTFRKKVLVVDCDPQCNSTQLIMGVTKAASLYTGSPEAVSVSTIKDLLQPIEDGDSTINTDLNFFCAAENRFSVDLLAGHPEFAIIEDRLGFAWGQLKARDRQGFRQTNWNALLCAHLANKYDLVFFDLGPSLGSINRTVLIGCEYFLTPLGSDIFSIIGVKNISKWLDAWIKDYRHSWEGLDPQTQKDLSDKYQVINSPSIEGGYVGYTVQQYITKSYAGVRRATNAYEQIIGGVDQEIKGALERYYAPNLANGLFAANLGDIPHLYSLVPLAQRKSVPIHGLLSEDGLVGSQFAAVRDFKKMIDPIARRLLENLGETIEASAK